MNAAVNARLMVALVAYGVGCAKPTIQRATTSSDSTAIVNGLLDPVAIAGEPPQRMRLTDRMADAGVTAVSIAVIRANRVVVQIAEGTLGNGSGPVTAATLYQAASISKPLTAVATMRLSAQGKFTVDDTVNGALRSWKIPANEFTAAEPVRIRHLLSHSAGATNGAVGIYRPGMTTPTLLQALDGLQPSYRPPVRIDFKPGSRARYSGGGYSILQQMLIDVTGKPFPRLMSDLVLDPVGMRASCFCQPLPDSLASRAAIGHDAKGQPIAGRWWTLPEMAAGGLWSTASDLARFVIAVNESWSGKRQDFLSTETVKRMFTPNVDGYGLGFEIDTVAGEIRALHTGSNNGYRGLIVSYPSRGDGLVILVNGDGGADLRYDIARAVAATFGWPGYAQATRSVSAKANPRLEEFVGAYSYAAPNQVTTIAVDSGVLVARYNDGPRQRLRSQSVGTFFALDNTTYEFERNADGVVASVLVTFSDGTKLRARSTR